LTVTNFLLFLNGLEPLLFAHQKYSFIIKIKYISNVFANNLRWLPHQIFPRWKMNNAIKALPNTHL